MEELAKYILSDSSFTSGIDVTQICILILKHAVKTALSTSDKTQALETNAAKK